MAEVAMPPREKGEFNEIDWAKNGELSTPTGVPGLTWLKILSASTEKPRV